MKHLRTNGPKHTDKENKMSKNLKYPNSRVDGGITSSNGMAQVGETYRMMEREKPTTKPAMKAPSDAVRPSTGPGLARKTMPYTPGPNSGKVEKMPYTPPKDGSGPGVAKMPFRPEAATTRPAEPKPAAVAAARAKAAEAKAAAATRPAAKKIDRTAERIAQTEAKRNAVGRAARAKSLAKQAAAKAAKRQIKIVD